MTVDPVHLLYIFLPICSINNLRGQILAFGSKYLFIVCQHKSFSFESIYLFLLYYFFLCFFLLPFQLSFFLSSLWHESILSEFFELKTIYERPLERTRMRRKEKERERQTNRDEKRKKEESSSMLFCYVTQVGR